MQSAMDNMSMVMKNDWMFDALNVFREGTQVFKRLIYKKETKMRIMCVLIGISWFEFVNERSKIFIWILTFLV